MCKAQTQAGPTLWNESAGRRTSFAACQFWYRESPYPLTAGEFHDESADSLELYAAESSTSGSLRHDLAKAGMRQGRCTLLREEFRIKSIQPATVHPTPRLESALRLRPASIKNSVTVH